MFYVPVQEIRTSSPGNEACGEIKCYISYYTQNMIFKKKKVDRQKSKKEAQLINIDD